MEQLGDYLVRRLIGEGGMGKVYEAEERLSKRRVALKVLHQELGKSDQGRRLFLNEMQILAHLEHPNIVRSLASTEVDGELVMVLEYLDGKNLRAILSSEGRLPWQEAIRIAASIASALAAAHGKDPPIIHRDLKPENIMILSDGTVKVMDFGIAKVIQAMNQTNTQSVGTLQYMSPEQIDAHTIDHRSDLYCLGLVMYELIAGRPPFHSASPRQLLNMQCTAEPPPLPEEVRGGLPRGVEQLLFQLLEKAPEDRPYMALDIVDKLEPFQTAAPTRTSHAGKSSSAAAITPHRQSQERSTPQRAESGSGNSGAAGASRDTGREAGGPIPARERGAEAPPPAAVASPSAGPNPPRADTIALVDQVSKAREVPTKVAVAVIVALSMLAGIGAYLMRSTSDNSTPESDASAAPAAVTSPAKKGNR